MILEADTTLTLGGFVAIASLALAAIGFALNASSKSAGTRERLAKLETQLEDHIRNGNRHERREEHGHD